MKGGCIIFLIVLEDHLLDTDGDVSVHEDEQSLIFSGRRNLFPIMYYDNFAQPYFITDGWRSKQTCIELNVARE